MAKTLANFDRYIEQALKDWNIPGAAVAVIKGDRALHSGGYGFRDLEKRLPVTKNTRFPIASMTKPFTAMGAALLVEEGVLNWDQPIREVMPEFRLADEVATQNANLRDLLSHRTGLPRHDATWYGTAKPKSALVESLRHLRPNAGFRSLWQYNNLMYETVGYLCAKLTGSENWQEFIQKRVLDPLGLDSSTPNFDETGTRFDDVALPYMLRRGNDKPERLDFYKDPQASPAGSIYSTLDDVAKWLKLHAQGGIVAGKSFVSPFNLKQMHIPHMLIPATAVQESLFNNNLFAYGLGWFIEPYKGVTLVHHGGNLDGFSVMGAFVPQEQLSIVVLTNIDGKGLRSALMYEALDRALGVDGNDWSREFLKRDAETVLAGTKGEKASKEDRLPNAPPTHVLEAYAGTYVAPGYDGIEITSEDGALWTKFYGKRWKMSHYHYDVFEIDMSSRFQQTTKLSFTLDQHGLITALNIAVEPSIGDMAFQRDPVTVGAEVQGKLAGRYTYPVEGQDVLISEKDGALLFELTGQARQPLRCVRESGDKLVYKLAGNEVSLLEFSGQGFRALAIKHPGAVFECERIE